MLGFHIKEWADRAAYPWYFLRGRRPWMPGYYTARKRAIEQALDRGLFHNGELPTGYGAHMDERVVEYPWVYRQLPEEPGRMLDAGSALNYEFLLQRDPVARAKLTICTLAPEKRCYYYRAISYVFDDLRHTMFRDQCFDTIVSISTIEHVGLDNTRLYTHDASKAETRPDDYRSVVREFRRLLKPGGVCLITVPFGRARVRGWFQVFDQTMVQDVLDHFGPQQSRVDYFAYGKEGWTRSCPECLTDVEFYDVHQDGPPPPDGAAGARAVACMRLEV
ncbi:MAG: methyltransferase domain-containing protein [Zetaproteobacteria bacterium]|nr:MAG: methyltransferase domain-containing protein [Zetaproteobacteria bacterium]